MGRQAPTTQCLNPSAQWGFRGCSSPLRTCALVGLSDVKQSGYGLVVYASRFVMNIGSVNETVDRECGAINQYTPFVVTFRW
jgi:hypothetical protein